MRLSALFAALVVCAAMVGTFAVFPAAGISPSATDISSPVTDAPHAVGPDTTVPEVGDIGLDTPAETEIRIVLHEEGNATWKITVRYVLEDETEMEAFDDLAQDYAGGTADGPISVDTFEQFRSLASETTNREMVITDVDRMGERNGTVGELTLEFTWSNFLGIQNNQLVLDEVFLTPTGEPWLGSLEANQVLIIETPRGYQVNTTPGVNPDLRDGNAWIEGPMVFSTDDRLIITYSPVESDPGTDEPTTSAPPIDSETSWEIIGAALLLGAAILAAALIYRRRSPDEEPAPGAVPSAEPSPPGSTDSGHGTEQDEEDDVDLSLLSDEERIERLLEKNDGRMRQATIVQETGWSDAKVSQLLSAMAAEGQIEKLRLGRENIISLPESNDEE